MSSSKVEVLCPNGHRVNVKTTSNTKILQILEEACTKKGFLPSSDYELKWGKKVLDVTLIMRYAGLPNLAKLELVKALQSRQDAGVMIALQLESGERLQQEFFSSSTLWDILKHWEEKDTKYKLSTSEEGNLNPVVIYLREEVIGMYALQHTALKTLGLTSGRAVLRLVHRTLDEETLADIRNKIDKERNRQVRLSSQADSGVAPHSQGYQSEKIQSQEPMEFEDSVVLSASGSSVEPMESKNVDNTNTGARPKDGILPSGGTHMNTTSAEPQQSNSGEHQITLSPQQEAVARQLAQNILPGIFPNQDPQEMEYLREQRRQQAAQKDWIMKQLQQQQLQQLQQTDFSNFKFPDETKGLDLYENDLSEVNKEDYKPCDRETVIYDSTANKVDLSNEHVSDDLPDDFFAINEGDIRKMYSDLQRQISEEAGPQLMTQAMRRAELENRMQCYKRVVVRFHFPDKLVVQAIFRPNETVYSLKKFVQAQIEGKHDFYLFTAPPKCVMKDEALSLIHAHIVPMSVVYVGFEQEIGQYLSAKVLQRITSHVEADKIVSKHMQSSEAAGTSDQVKRPKSASSTDEQEKTKVPKWFKIGNK